MAIKATNDDVVKAAQVLFETRKKMANDSDPAHRHPMLYREKKWADLPIPERLYYMDMAHSVFHSFGIVVNLAVKEVT